MSRALITLAIVLSALAARSQNDPECSDLQVTRLDAAPGKKVIVEIRNNCGSCASGVNGGCVYYELRVVRAVAPYDTIAASKCYCNWTPDNQSTRTYTIGSKASSLPHLKAMRVSFECGQIGCDSIPVDAKLLALPESGDPSPRFFIDPNGAVLSVDRLRPGSTLRIISLWSAEVLGFAVEGHEATVELHPLAPGIYVAVIAGSSGDLLGVHKFVRQ